jgi:hypothetical protein
MAKIMIAVTLQRIGDTSLVGRDFVRESSAKTVDAAVESVMRAVKKTYPDWMRIECRPVGTDQTSVVFRAEAEVAAMRKEQV